MIDAECISETLEALTDDATSRRYAKEHSTLRGIRGVPTGEIARLGDAVWAESGTELPRDRQALQQLYGAAWEDGLVAIGLLATCVPDTPAEALAVGEAWLHRIDDLVSADALGWLVIGGAALATQSPLPVLEPDAHLMASRALASAAMAWIPCPIEGPSAAPLRAKLGTRQIQWTDRTHPEWLAPHCTALLRDRHPCIQKALRRVVKAWATASPEEVTLWASNVPGGIPKVLRADIQRIVKKAARAKRT